MPREWVEAALTTLRVVRVPLRVRFRGLVEREVALIQGPHGWGEFGPFLEYPPAEARAWLAAALEAAYAGWPAPVRDRVGVNATVPAVAALWPEMTRRVGQHNKNLPALLTMCKPLAMEGRTIILGFDYPLLKDKFDKTAGAADAVVAALRALSNTDCLIRTVTTADYPVPIHKDEFQALATELGGVVRDDE